MIYKLGLSDEKEVFVVTVMKHGPLHLHSLHYMDPLVTSATATEDSVM